MTPVYEYTFVRQHVRDVDFRAASNSADVADAVDPLFRGAETERLVGVALDAHIHILGIETVYVGNVSAALVRVGELFRLPVRLNAKSLVIAHNHPSGSLEPSLDDLHLTAEVARAGRILDIQLLDHLIVVDAPYRGTLAHLSLRDRGVDMGDAS